MHPEYHQERIYMPLPLEISIRLANPKDYEYFRRKPVPSNHHWAEKFGDDVVDYIYGFDKKTKTLEIQAIRIKVKSPNQFTKEEIEDYIKERKLTPVKVEMPKDYSEKSLFEMHPFEMTAEPLHQPSVEYYHDFESSNIESIEFDYLRNVLKVVFKGNVQYLYSAIPASIAVAFKHSVSKGQFFSQRIKNRGYPVKRLDIV